MTGVQTCALPIFSFMGYIPDTEPLLRASGPAVANALLSDAVDLVLLVPS